MKFTNLKNNPLIGKVYNDDKTKCFGLYGQVGSLLEAGILYDINAGREMWIFLDQRTDSEGTCIPQPSRDALIGWLTYKLAETPITEGERFICCNHNEE